MRPTSVGYPANHRRHAAHPAERGDLAVVNSVSAPTFSTYQGELPAGLSWDITAQDTVDTLGQPVSSYTAGGGVEQSFTYMDAAGYTLNIMLAATHQQDLWTSPMHIIEVIPA